MPHGLHGERTLMRIFLGEGDRCGAGPHKGKPLYEAILLTLREEGCAGATVVRAIAGFGPSAKLHTGKVLRLSSDLPVIVESHHGHDRWLATKFTVKYSDQASAHGIYAVDGSEVAMQFRSRGGSLQELFTIEGHQFDVGCGDGICAVGSIL